MSRLMAKHASRTDSSFLQLQARVPVGVVERLRGTIITVEFPAMRADPSCSIPFKLGRTVKGSLRTRDPEVATQRRLRTLEHLSRLYASARSGPTSLGHRQRIALAGEVYALLRANFDDDPGSVEEWAAWKSFVRAAREGRIPTAPTIDPREQADEREEAARLFGPDLTAGIDAMPLSGDRAALEDRCGRLAWWVLSRHGVVVDRETRLQLLEAVADACLDAGWALKRAAGGDYTPDPEAQRFPAFEERSAGITLTALFDRWQAETKPAAKTVVTWRAVVKSLSSHVGHDDAGRITDREIVAWKDSRVAAGRSLKTVGDTDLAAVRSLYRYGIANRVLSLNPADGVRVTIKKTAGTGMLPYSDAEVARLLALAADETHPARRWLPPLAATSGARIGELSQLWGERIRVEDGVNVMSIELASDGGHLKNAGSERIVPIHPAVIQAGFLSFVESRGDGPLFYGRTSGKPGKRHAADSAANHVATWIRAKGFDDARKAPNHAMRHWFKTACARVGIADSVADAIQGHAAKSDAGRYRHFDLKTLERELARLPVPRLDDDKVMQRGVPARADAEADA